MTLTEVFAARAENRRRMRTASPAVREIRAKMDARYAELIVAMMREGCVMEWQPIETAPDDIDVLVWCADRERSYIGYRAWSVVQKSDTDDNVLRPTHWMPLPTAPTT